MIDIENTISNLETNIRWIEDIPSHQFPGWGNVTMSMRDALELLKEQDNCENCAIAIEDRQLVVRCKDCKWYSEKGFCKHPNGGAGNIRPANWFCADGERRLV